MKSFTLLSALLIAGSAVAAPVEQPGTTTNPTPLALEQRTATTIKPSVLVRKDDGKDDQPSTVEQRFISDFFYYVADGTREIEKDIGRGVDSLAQDLVWIICTPGYDCPRYGVKRVARN